MMKRTTKVAILAFSALAALAVATAGAAVAHANGMFGGRAIGGFSEAADGALEGTFVTAAVDVAGGVLHQLDLKDANSTRPLVSSLALTASGGATFTGTSLGRHHGYALSDGAGNRLVIEDSPRAGFAATSVNGTTFVLVIPEGVAITLHDAVDAWSPAGATLDYGNGRKANLVLKDATLSVSGQTLMVTLDAGGAAGYGLVPGEGGFGFGHGPAFGFRGHGVHGGMHGHGPRGHR